MTAPTATSYEALVYDRAISTLANSATFRALVGAATPTLARGRIIEYDGGRQAKAAGTRDAPQAVASDGSTFDLVLAHAVVRCGAFPTTDPAVAYQARTGQVEILVVIPDDTVDADNLVPPWRYRRFLNLAGAIRAEIAAQTGSSTGLALAAVSLEPEPLADDTGGLLAKAAIARILIDWRSP